MVALMKLPGYHVSPLLDLAPINEGLDSVAKARQLAAQNARLDKQDARADEQMGMEKQRFTAQQQDRMRKLLAGRSQMILDEPDDAKAAQIFQRHFSTPEIQAAIKENGLDPTDFRGVAKAIHAEALGPVDPLERKKTEAQIAQSEEQTALARRQAAAPVDDGSRVIESGGQIFRVPRQGNATVIGGLDPVQQAEKAVAARRQQVIAAGIDPESPAAKAYMASGKMPREDQQPLTATDKKAILEADEAVTRGQSVVGNLDKARTLSKDAYSGPGAGPLGYVTSLWGNKRGEATEELNNLITSNSLQELKSIFGGNPTEGERRILLDIQGSVNKAPHVREEIWARAREMAAKRLELARRQADEIRGGTYYKPQGQPKQPAPSVDYGWSIKRID